MRGISSMATRQVLAALAEAAVAEGHASIAIESVGGVDAERRVVDGESFDLVLLASAALRRLAAAGAVDPSSVTPLFLSEVAVGVAGTGVGERPAGAAWPDGASFRAALRSATRIGYSTGPSGTAFLELLDAWGLSDDLQARLVQARPGVPVARLIADGEVDLGLQQLSELVGEPGVRVLGTLPDDCAIATVFSGAVGSASVEAQAASELLRFFASDDAASVVRAHGFDVP